MKLGTTWFKELFVKKDRISVDEIGPGIFGLFRAVSFECSPTGKVREKRAILHEVNKVNRPSPRGTNEGIGTLN